MANFPCRAQITMTKEMMATIKKWAKREQTTVSCLLRKVLKKRLKGKKG